MKKIICAVFCMAVGLMTVSCEVASLEEGQVETVDLMKSIDNVNASRQDSIPPDISPTIGDGEGPGDEVFPIKPPKKIN